MRLVAARLAVKITRLIASAATGRITRLVFRPVAGFEAQAWIKLTLNAEVLVAQQPRRMCLRNNCIEQV